MTQSLLDLHQGLLVLEHEAIWTFETIAARSSQLRKRAKQSAIERRVGRDHARQSVLDLGGEPAAPLPSYESTRLTTNDQMAVEAQRILSRLAALHLEIVAATTGIQRGQSIDDLSQVSVSRVTWGAPAQAFPGLDS